MSDQRPAVPTDPPCSCGAEAVLVFITARWGDIPWCGVDR